MSPTRGEGERSLLSHNGSLDQTGLRADPASGQAGGHTPGQSSGQASHQPGGLGLGLFIIVLAGLLVVRIAALAVNQTDLFFDEAQYWTWAKDPAWGYYSKPPVIGWVIALTTGALGDTPFAIRLGSPILHTLTAVFILLAAKRIYGDMATAALAGILFAILPGISFSSGVISTDVPLLTCFAAALWLLSRYLAAPSARRAALLGVAIGAGLLAKYAMAYFFLGLVVWMLVSPVGRPAIFNWRFLPAPLIAVALLAPNLWWNFANGGVTFSHTADNAKWGGPLFHPDKMGEFFAAQFGVFGPILFAALLIIAWRAVRSGRSPGTTRVEPLVTSADVMLLAFALPVIAVVTTQALLSRAHANWAAVAYVPAVIVVAATLLKDRAVWARRATYVLHGVVVLLLAAGLAVAPQVQLPGGAAPFARVLGWENVLGEVAGFVRRQQAEGAPFAAIVADDRAVLAQARFYLRNLGLPILAWQEDRSVDDHYELTTPFPETGTVAQRLASSGETASSAGAQAKRILILHHRQEMEGLLALAQTQRLKEFHGDAGVGAARSLYAATAMVPAPWITQETRQ